MFDLYQHITDRIVSALEQGTVPWHQPWSASGEGCYSYTTGKPYSLLNTILLGGRSGEYITFKAAAEAGGHIRKGEKSKLVVFWKMLEQTDKDTGEVRLIPYLHYYNVFHLDQTEGISPKRPVSAATVSDLKPDDKAEAVIRSYVERSGVRLNITRSDSAFYSPAKDSVTVPELSQYTCEAEYYSTLFHELTHSTGHASRLNRLTDYGSMFSQSYSKEELIAELGSAFLVNTVGLETQASFSNSAAYIQGWLKVLKDNKKLIISAAGAAEKAVSYIMGADNDEQQ